MAAGNGFQTSRPTATYGGDLGTGDNGYVFAQKFTCPSSGTKNFTEFGMWGGVASGTGISDMRIYTDDAVNNCPETQVTNSSSGNLSWTETTFTIKYTALSSCQGTGGVAYWLCHRLQDATLHVAGYTTGGTGVYLTTGWPTDAGWHTHTDDTYDLSPYVVYSAAVGNLSINVADCVDHVEQLK